MFLAVGAIGGCGGGGGSDECDFDFNSFLNGPNAQFADSEWDCIDNFFELFAFQAFEDGAGFSTDLGPFTFQQIGCRRAAFQSGLGDGEIVNIEGSIASGVLTFDQVSNVPELDGLSAGCLLVVF